MQTYGPGTLAFVDSFLGLIPCKVLRVNSNGTVRVRITADRGVHRTWRKGEWVDSHADRIVPRSHVVQRSGAQYIRGGYSWSNNGKV